MGFVIGILVGSAVTIALAMRKKEFRHAAVCCIADKIFEKKGVLLSC